ncbi:MAG: thioredoxin-disulfide reductase [Proteobacteria bacterium]|nr:thioredoxin-disulfide reductase [Pseudomonadota bacterium]
MAEKVVIIGSGPAAHTAAIYAARAELKPVLFEGFMAGGVAAGGQLTTTTDVENFPGFPQGIQGPELCQRFRDQSERFGTRIHTETVNSVDLSRRPFRYVTDEREGEAEVLIIATGATAKRLDIPGAGDDELWQKGISACAVCDGALPLFRNQPLVVIGGGDSAVEEATFLTKYGSRVYIVHRRDELRASKIMQKRALDNNKIEMMWSHVVVAASGAEELESVRVKDVKSDEERDVAAKGLFFAIGHTPNTEFLDGQLTCDEQGYLITKPDSTQTSVPGVFAAGDVQDKKWRQAITAAGTGCMAALEAEHFLAANPST